MASTGACQRSWNGLHCQSQFPIPSERDMLKAVCGGVAQSLSARALVFPRHQPAHFNGLLCSVHSSQFPLSTASMLYLYTLFLPSPGIDLS